MKVTFISNYLTHHQIPFCNEMEKHFGDDFKFIATECMEQDRIEMGWNTSNVYGYEIQAYKDKQSFDRALDLCYLSDVVIIGNAHDVYVVKRIKESKITFRYSERIFKKGRWRIISPRAIKNLYQCHRRYKNKPVYMLCASAYTASDFALAGAYIDKTYKWGYFPEVIEYDLNELFAKKNNDIMQILWVGRFLKWKHPEKAVLTAEKLKKDGYKFKLNMIGDGVTAENIKNLIKVKHLEDCVELLGSMSPGNVREHMEKANIFLFTSDYNEGWGAVLNESMNSGCAVVVSHAIGSVLFLIKHTVNGLVYKNDDTNDLYHHVKSLMDNEKLRIDLGKQAYLTLKNTWNAENAVNNLLKLIDSIMENKENVILDGPCSKAEIIYNNWINKGLNIKPE